MKNCGKVLFIIILSIIACIILFIVERILGVSYVYKSIIKVLLFLCIPFLFKIFFNSKQENNKTNLDINYFMVILLGGISFIIVMCSFFIFKNCIDTPKIVSELNKANITKDNYIFIGIYIILINSFIEEFFFRGFVFLQLNKFIGTKQSSFFSAFLFAIYHISIFKTWFILPILFLSLIGLLCIGLIFNHIDKKNNSIFKSWFIHMIADISVIVIGFLILFRLVNL